MKIKIKSFNGELPEYLTVGKVYQVCGRDGDRLLIYDDGNDRDWIRLERCAFLNGGSWEIVSE